MSLTLAWMLAVHIALTAAPGVAAVFFAMRRGVRDLPWLLGIGLAASGVAAMLTFWAYFAEPWIGKACAYSILAASIAVGAWCWPAVRRRPELLRQLAVPVMLWMLAAVSVVFLGFLHGGTDEPQLTSATRFSHPLPADNVLPLFFADWFFENGHDGEPPRFADSWLSSDRPPLQIGYALEQRPVVWDSSGLHYQLLGVVVQQLWVVGLWALLTAFQIRGLTRGLVMVATLVSDVAIVNAFFVWPKLIGAAFLLAAAALVLRPSGSDLKREPGTTVLMACLCALALLAHGTSAFVVLPLLAIAALRGLPSWRWVGAGLLAGALLLAPWSAYQRWFDPPGDRLQKWFLAGDVYIDERSTGEAIRDSYAEVGLDGALESKWDNFRFMIGEGPPLDQTADGVDQLVSGEAEDGVRDLRGPRFFNLVPALGLFALAPFVMLGWWVWTRRRRRSGPVVETRHQGEWSLALACLGLAAAGCAIWILVLFGPPNATAWLHVGSLAVPILAVCGAVAGLRATFPRIAVALVCLNALIVLALYVPPLDPPPGSSFSAAAAVIALISLIAFGWVALGSGLSDQPGTGLRLSRERSRRVDESATSRAEAG